MFRPAWRELMQVDRRRIGLGELAVDPSLQGDREAGYLRKIPTSYHTRGAHPETSILLGVI